MSRKAAPKPEELIQKLEEKFDSFKVGQDEANCDDDDEYKNMSRRR